MAEIEVLKDQICKLEKNKLEIGRLKEKICELEQDILEIGRLKEKMCELEKDKLEIGRLNEKNCQLENQLKKERGALAKIFTKGQLEKLKTKKQIRWSVEDIASAISLYAGGPRSYRLLRKRGYPLPAVSTIKRWASKVNLQPGNSALNI